jgi:hypothetical protein
MLGAAVVLKVDIVAIYLEWDRINDMGSEWGRDERTGRGVTANYILFSEAELG